MICLRRAAAALLAAWLTAPMLAAATAAQDFPTRTVRLVLAFPAGGAD
jgi:tripartite-type tricarboxylate transporter receptor subunit TctC